MDYIKGRGAQHNTHNKFIQHQHEVLDDFLNYCEAEKESADNNKTTYLEIYPKTILNKVKSPDIGFSYSMNPYQGCEHGCIYCYARNTHEYWGYSAGLDFERKILYKTNAPELLEKKLRSRNWQPQNIMFSGNTDCYQPIEKKLEITRKMLQVLLKLKHPASMITKNALILRDLDILKEMAAMNLVRVNISITSLLEETRRVVEPRTATIEKRLETVKTLAENNIPVNVMMAPIIPSINSHEILPLVKKVSELGATSVAYTIVRLNGAIGEIFTNWVRKTYPDRANKILHQIEDTHKGSLNDSRYGSRMRGEGKIAEQINTQFKLARKLYLKDKTLPPLDYTKFDKYQTNQTTLF
ncbi:PA0069 family radical SAM protein [Tenacibaculum mesophilum]|uniref:PA0069 family radical SAM protein n=1 Tax=Tenacibaculum mesophilum TaxID=104268 RepID=A0ABM7CEJ4_9FLAO|nr:PA0069 family radical SAM protein [Tenacibaculum mesophilum]AZJ32163.1 PA0069 family radical SAM protein [Tenacibaculum mesophilum]QFS27421.1 PA0069 family radical SAM protein [Tenacibaculum mesophilum]